MRLDDNRILMDTTPDFRYQALRYGIDHLDAILYAHTHADHILGLDDVRPFNFLHKKNIPIYASAETLDGVEELLHGRTDSKGRSRGRVETLTVGSTRSDTSTIH